MLSGFLLYRPWARWGIEGRRRAVGPRLRASPAGAHLPGVPRRPRGGRADLPADRPEGLGDWFRAATLTWIYVPDDLRLALFQTWSLGTELSWYVALPVLVVSPHCSRAD